MSVTLAFAEITTAEMGLPVPVNQKHLFAGEIRGARAKGFHHCAGVTIQANARIVSLVDPPNSLGVYTAEVAVRDPGTGTWHPKPFSTFFPDTWTRQRVLDEIEHAYTHRTWVVGSDWEGPSTVGFTILGHMRPAGVVDSAHPIWTNV